MSDDDEATVSERDSSPTAEWVDTKEQKIVTEPYYMPRKRKRQDPGLVRTVGYQPPLTNELLMATPLSKFLTRESEEVSKASSSWASLASRKDSALATPDVASLQQDEQRYDDSENDEEVEDSSESDKHQTVGHLHLPFLKETLPKLRNETMTTEEIKYCAEALNKDFREQVLPAGSDQQNDVHFVTSGTRRHLIIVCKYSQCYFTLAFAPQSDGTEGDFYTLAEKRSHISHRALAHKLCILKKKSLDAAGGSERENLPKEAGRSG